MNSCQDKAGKNMPTTYRINQGTVCPQHIPFMVWDLTTKKPSHSEFIILTGQKTETLFLNFAVSFISIAVNCYSLKNLQGKSKNKLPPQKKTKLKEKTAKLIKTTIKKPTKKNSNNLTPRYPLKLQFAILALSLFELR